MPAFMFMEHWMAKMTARMAHFLLHAGQGREEISVSVLPPRGKRTDGAGAADAPMGKADCELVVHLCLGEDDLAVCPVVDLRARDDLADDAAIRLCALEACVVIRLLCDRLLGCAEICRVARLLLLRASFLAVDVGRHAG